jgi:hypothetical protein
MSRVANLWIQGLEVMKGQPPILKEWIYMYVNWIMISVLTYEHHIRQTFTFVQILSSLMEDCI